MKSYKLMIKATFSNAVHKLLSQNNVAKSSILKSLSDKQKAELFDQIIDLHKEHSGILRNAMQKRRYKNKVNRLRHERGYYEVKLEKALRHQQRMDTENPALGIKYLE